MPDKVTVASQCELSPAEQLAAVPLATPVSTAPPPAKDRSLAHAIGKNTIFGVVARVAQAGTRLITVPIVIAHLGLGGYGIWAIIMTAAAYMRFGSIGIKSAFQKYVAEATGNGNYEQANRLLSTGSAAMFVLSVAGLVPISLFSRQLASILGVPPEFLKSAAGAISMLAVIMVLSNVAAAYEAIIMGGHRIDLARKFTTFFNVAEAVGIILVLHYGLGLFAMATVMGVSEVGFIACCYVAAKKVVPEVQLGRKHITRAVLPELFRYAGSYQLVNVMEVVYAAIIPVALLRVFGDEAAGVYALANRLESSALMLPDAFLLPILSGGAKVYNSGSPDEMNRLISKSFKVTLALSLLPLAFLGVFGTTIVYAWTGQSPASLQATLWLLCITGFFYSFSILALVLYRTSGRALHDNIRQLLRILMLFSVALFAARAGYLGVLTGLACAELFGMVFMLYAISKTYPGFHLQSMLPQTLKLLVTTAICIAVGILFSHAPLPASLNPRMLATVQLALAFAGCVLAAGPALWVTKSVTAEEKNALLHTLVPRRFRSA
jgi:O-antigen/teichoic acid export membrane protein